MSASPLDIFNEEIHSNILSNLKEHQQRGCTFSVSLELLASFLSGGIFSTIRNIYKKMKKVPICEVFLKNVTVYTICGSSN